jgi:hypothetical protein
MKSIGVKVRYEFVAIVTGILLFVIFFILAASHYPGGSNFDATSIGYKWNFNYWCELLGDYSKSGVPNTARPFGFVGMVALAFSVSIFWYTVPKKIHENQLISVITSVTGILSMFFSAFIFTSVHDLVIFSAVICGSISFLLLFYGIYKTGSKHHFRSGVICLLMIFANCFIYITELGIEYLPSLQKITFLLTLSWIILISFHYLKPHDSTV